MLLKLTRLSKDISEHVSESFNSLPETDYLDGKYRLRKYSVICRDFVGEYKSITEREFLQSKDYNSFQGDIPRNFEEIEDSVIKSSCIKEACDLLINSGDFPYNNEIEVHQIRIRATDGNAEVSPEGIHQDGFSMIAFIGIGRHNIEGGKLLVYKGKDLQPFMSLPMDAGDVIIANDTELWHNASPINTIDELDAGHMDAFVLTIK